MSQSEIELIATTWTTRSQVQEFNREDIQFHTTQKLKTSSDQCAVCQDSDDFKLSIKKGKDIINYNNDNKDINQKIQQKKKASGQGLFKIINEKDHAVLQSMGYTIYEVISSRLDGKSIEIKNGDKYKFGKKEIKILFVGMFQPVLELSQNYIQNDIISFQKDKTQQIIDDTLFSQHSPLTDLQFFHKCRFCLAQSRSSQNPVLNCCGCKGINNALHSMCLKRWIKSKTTKGIHKTGDNYIVMKKGLKCQVCEKYFSFKYSIPLLLDLNINQYILFQDQQYIYITYCHQKQILTIGRSNSSHLQLNQTTVSRYHAQIFYNNKKCKYYIRDLKSKFGTLKKLDTCTVQNTIDIQVGRNLFKVRRIPKVSFLSRFLKFCARQEMNFEEDEKKAKKIKE